MIYKRIFSYFYNPTILQSANAVNGMNKCITNAFTRLDFYHYPLVSLTYDKCHDSNQDE